MEDRWHCIRDHRQNLRRQPAPVGNAAGRLPGQSGYLASRTTLTAGIMIMALLRIPLTIVFAYTLVKATLRYSEINGGDMIFLLGYALVGSVFVAILWAPV